MILQVIFFLLDIFAVIVAVPAFLAFTSPFRDTVAAFLLELVQTTLSVAFDGFKEDLS
ncbi:MAG: hypothetical protein RHS_5789 [Robinsoniella sp. RHS]|nr:MAG: hypothetical protein RHS_6148 [Robinsoniella sp. RHS]KLU68384.1 MAG: hypothetical protein RHS_5789 [Robinsoniella sp. RHS]